MSKDAGTRYSKCEFPNRENLDLVGESFVERLGESFGNNERYCLSRLVRDSAYETNHPENLDRFLVRASALDARGFGFC